MACFLVPGAEAIVTTIAAKIISSKEKKEATAAAPAPGRLPFSVKLGWLNKLLWGGCALLALEHLWHGEIIPSFPFLTAVGEGQEATAEMLSEMATSGTAMALLVTLAWCVMLAVSAFAENRAASRSRDEQEARQ